MPQDSDNFPFFVFGNKKDKEIDRAVTKQQAKDWCKKHNAMPWEETSALDINGID